MKLIAIAGLFVAMSFVIGGSAHLRDQDVKSKLFERNDRDNVMQTTVKHDGHRKEFDSIIGKHDGHDEWMKHSLKNQHNTKLIGQPDGHDGATSKQEWISDIWKYENSMDNYEDTDQNLVRCKRPNCDNTMSCPFGPQTDVNGCPTCHCLEDPCLEEQCETGYQCRPVDCLAKPCKKLEAKCEKKRCDGPEPMCATYCPLGYQLNDRGCMTCKCRDTKNLHNFTAEWAKTTSSSLEDSDSKDSEEEDEEDEYYGDGDYDDSLIIEDLDEHLKEQMSKDLGDGKFDDEEQLGEMCEGTRCRLNEICRADWKYPGDSENERTNRICMIKTRCWAVANEPRLYPDHRNPDRRQACDSSLVFEPLQCMGYNPNIKNHTKTCWCTNDLGYVIDGTFTVIYAEEQKPICERNTTVSATLSMKFEILKQGTGERTIVEVLTDELSKITFAPKGSIKIASVDYPKSPVKQSTGYVLVFFILNNHPDYDLPYALDLLFNVKDFQLNFDLYSTKLVGKASIVHYQFSSPAPPVMENEDDSSLLDGLEPLPNFHHDNSHHSVGYHGSFFSRTLVIVCLIVLTSLILVVLSIIVLLARRNCRRGHIRHHQLQNQISVAIDPEQLLNDPRKNESVILVTDDVLSKVKDSSIA